MTEDGSAFCVEENKKRRTPCKPGKEVHGCVAGCCRCGRSATKGASRSGMMRIPPARRTGVGSEDVREIPAAVPAGVMVRQQLSDPDEVRVPAARETWDGSVNLHPAFLAGQTLTAEAGFTVADGLEVDVPDMRVHVHPRGTDATASLDLFAEDAGDLDLTAFVDGLDGDRAADVHVAAELSDPGVEVAPADPLPPIDPRDPAYTLRLGDPAAHRNPLLDPFAPPLSDFPDPCSMGGMP